MKKITTFVVFLFVSLSCCLAQMAAGERLPEGLEAKLKDSSFGRPRIKIESPSALTRWKSLSVDGMPAGTNRHQTAVPPTSANAGDYPYPLPLYDYIEYRWLPDDADLSYREDDEILWSLPSRQYETLPKPAYGMGVGAFIEHGKLHTYVSDFSYSFLGVYFFNMVTYDAETMQVLKRCEFDNSDLSNFCISQCQYPLDETKGIGIFYNAELDGRDWALLDYENETVTRLGYHSERDYGILVTDGAYLYGWSNDNCIYRIDPNTFTSTLVGSHGFVHYMHQTEGDEGGAYIQSATYDQKTQTCYWGAFNAATGESGIYKVDLQTAQIQKVIDTYVTQHLGLCTEPQTADDLVPGPVTDLTLSFEAPSRQGKATFTLPTHNYIGTAALDEPLTYKFTQGSTVIAEVEGMMPGQQITVDLSMRKDGNYTFAVQTCNSVGWSVKAKKKLYVGYDTPVASPSVVLNIDKQGFATLQWEAPAEGTHGGYIDNNLTYDIYRIHGTQTTCVALSVSDLTWSEQLPLSAITSYKYAVVADNHGHQSDFSYSNAAPCGKAYECPVVVNFTDVEVFNLFNVYDANQDNYKWYFDNDRHYLGYACYRYNGQQAADDWLFSPSIRFEAGRTYTLGYTASCVQMNLPERLSIALCSAQRPDSLVDWIEYRRDLPMTVRNRNVTFTVPADGEYCVGFHACSDPNELDLMLRCFRIDAAPLAEAPAKVDSFSCVAGDQGALNANLHFFAPTTTADGTPLTRISRLCIERDLYEVQRWSDVEPGQELSFFDEVGTAGYHTWEVFAYIEDLKGDCAEQRLYLGYDQPAQVTTGYVVDNQNSLDICWEPVTIGAHGGYIDPDDVTYEVRDYTHKVQGTTQGNSVTVACDDTDAGEYRITYYRIYSINNQGFVDCTETEHHLMGPIAQLPFAESAPKGNPQQTWWFNTNEMTNYTVAVGTGISSDDDDGCFGWMCYSPGDQLDMNTIKLDFAGIENPALRFSYASDVADFSIEAFVTTPDHQRFPLCYCDFSEIAPGNWINVRAEMPKELADYRYGVVTFRLHGEEEKQWLILDDIEIYDAPDSGIEDIHSDAETLRTRKYLMGGRLLIRTGHSTYDATGRGVGRSLK